MSIPVLQKTMGRDRMLKGQNKLTPNAALREHNSGHDYQLPIFRSEEAHPTKMPQEKPGAAQAQIDLTENSKRVEYEATKQSKSTSGKRMAEQPQGLQESEIP